MRADEIFGVSDEIRTDSYVDRGSLDEELSKRLARRTHLALRGASRMGKSWLRQRLLPDAIVVNCRFGQSTTDIYRQSLAALGLSLQVSSTKGTNFEGSLQATGEVGIKLLAKVSASLGGKVVQIDETTSRAPVEAIDDLPLIAQIIKDSGRRLVVEDFHYLAVSEQKIFASDLKALWDLGCFVVVIGIWGQKNLLLQTNSDLRGRVHEESIVWSPEELRAVLDKGSRPLNVKFSDELARRMVADCYGNVGLLQALALETLDKVDIRETAESLTEVSSTDAFEEAAMFYSEQLATVFQGFADNVSGGIRKRNNSTGIYPHTLAVILEQDDASLKAGVPLDTIFSEANRRESRIQKPNLKQILPHLQELQVDEEGRGLVLTYNASNETVVVVDHELLFYRKYQTISWPWEDLIREAQAHD